MGTFICFNSAANSMLVGITLTSSACPSTRNAIFFKNFSPMGSLPTDITLPGRMYFSTNNSTNSSFKAVSLP